MRWCQRQRPELADDLPALRQSAHATRAVVTRDFLDFLPKLKAGGRLHVGTDNTDLEACKERGIKVIAASSANESPVFQGIFTGAVCGLFQAC